MVILRVLAYSVGIGILGCAVAVSQIPAKGSDFPTLSILRWGMSIQAARDLISSKREIQKSTSSTLSYEDTLLNAKAIITLKFAAENFCLNGIDASLSKPNKELYKSVYTYLVTRYGDKYVSTKEQKTKFFIKFDMEMKLWRLDDEGVGMGIFSRGDDVIGINIFYTHANKKN
jgi:hypothetical protein